MQDSNGKAGVKAFVEEPDLEHGVAVVLANDILSKEEKLHLPVSNSFKVGEYHILRSYGDDGRDPLLPDELPEELGVEVQWSLGCNVGVGHVVAIDERKQD